MRRLHKAFLRYHDAENWPVLRDALRRMGRADLIGNSKRHLVPAYQPLGTGKQPEGARRPNKYQAFRTQQTGLPPAPVATDKKFRKPAKSVGRSSRPGR